MLKLKVSGASKEGIWLVEPKVSVGSANNNNLVISDPEVDDCHIEIFAKGEELIIHRRSDANTLVNGKPLGVKARLIVDDEIVIGKTKLVVVDPKVERAKQTALQTETTAPSKAQAWTLNSSQSGLNRNTYPINDGTVVGRAKDCDIVILLAHLSRRHAQFNIVGNNRLEIADLSSSNGTFVNGKQITTAILNHGDEVRFDTISFTVQGPSDDLDKTMVRPMTADELSRQMAAATKIPKSQPEPKPISSPTSQPNASSAPVAGATPANSSRMAIVLGLVVVLVGAAVAAWVLS